MFYMHALGWRWWMVMSIGMLAFWALVVYGIVSLLRRGQNVHRRDDRPPDTPEEILKRRLARGEISTDDYERLHEAIEGKPHELVAASSLVEEQRQGQALVAQLQAGVKTCSDLSVEDLDHVGEYVMFRALGSTSLHRAMNDRMTLMLVIDVRPPRVDTARVPQV